MIYVFDMDETLIHVNAAKCVADAYLKIHPLGKTSLYPLFKCLYEQGESVWVLTNRDPHVQMEAADVLGVAYDRILCRNFDRYGLEKTKEELIAMNHDKAQLHEFFRKMTAWKKGVLEAFGKEDHVLYFDDMGEWMKDDPPPNVTIVVWKEQYCGDDGK